MSHFCQFFISGFNCAPFPFISIHAVFSRSLRCLKWDDFRITTRFGLDAVTSDPFLLMAWYFSLS